MATVRETAQRSQDTMNTDIPTQAVDKLPDSKEDSGRIKIPKDCCIGCGKKKHSDKTTFLAKVAACPCGRTGGWLKVTFVLSLCLGQAVCFMSIVKAPLLLCKIVTPSLVGRVMDCQEKTKVL